MEKRDWLSRFMEGKKKYSASIIIPIAIAVINMLAVTGIIPQSSQTTLEQLIQEFLPTLVALLGGIAYTVVEGINDNARVKNSLAAAVTATAGQDQLNAGQQFNIQTKTGSAGVDVQKSAPLDKEAFIAEIEKVCQQKSGVRNAATLYYAVRQVLRSWRFDSEQAYRDAWNLVWKLVNDYFKEVWNEDYEDALLNVKKPDKNGCTYPDIEFKSIQLGMPYYVALLELREVREVVDSL